MHSNSSHTTQITELYRSLLKREPDAQGLQHWEGLVRSGQSIDMVRDAILAGQEYKSLQGYAEPPALLVALHQSRVEMVRQLPKAARILDLGGGAINEPRGALVVMGYPYSFDELHIIEPPPSERHEIYQNIPDLKKVVPTALGPVTYHYGSMAELSRFPDESFDMVLSGETIEHVTVEECKRTLSEVRRVLKPEGSFCFDTPNRAVTIIQAPNSYINPEHKIEYRHNEMLALIKGAGLNPIEMKGITYMPQTVSTRRFIEAEMLNNRGMYSDLEKCYLLYYRCVRA
jgi:SAM-dependent methyltransferase